MKEGACSRFPYTPIYPQSFCLAKSVRSEQSVFHKQFDNSNALAVFVDFTEFDAPRICPLQF